MASGNEQAEGPRQSHDLSSSHRIEHVNDEHCRPPGSWPLSSENDSTDVTQEREHPRGQQVSVKRRRITSTPTPPRKKQISYWKRFSSFFASEPAIIEYSDREIRRQTKVLVVADDSRASDDTDEGVQVNVVVFSGSRKYGKRVAERMPVEAKYKRVREIAKAEVKGGFVEDQYAKEIRVAFKRLKVERHGKSYGSGGREGSSGY